MDYFVGVVLALSVGLGTTLAGFDRDRALYPAILLVVASYYDLFAVMGGGDGLGWEIGGFAVFALASIIGFRTNLWIVAVALVGHGLFDLVHGRVIANAGAPEWWPMFCMSYDVVAGVYLAWRLLIKKIDATNPSSFGRRIDAHVEAELVAARRAELGGDPSTSFRRLERAHVLGQRSTVQHVRVHLHMLMWGIRQQDPREVIGQTLRVIGASVGTWIGLVPHGNTGGANVSGLRSMAIPDDLAALIETARAPAANSN